MDPKHVLLYRFLRMASERKVQVRCNSESTVFDGNKPIKVIKTLHKLSREVEMSCFVCFVLQLKKQGKERNIERCTAARLYFLFNSAI